MAPETPRAATNRVGSKPTPLQGVGALVAASLEQVDKVGVWRQCVTLGTCSQAVRIRPQFRLRPKVGDRLLPGMHKGLKHACSEMRVRLMWTSTCLPSRGKPVRGR